MLILLAAALAGCGTTRWSDSPRTATEQLLLSDAIDKAVNQVDIRVLSGKTVYFNEEYLKTTLDQGYLSSSLRQHLLASGCILKEKPDDATYIVEARSGGVGTDRNELLFGVPAVNVPAIGVAPGVPHSIPEIPFAKRTDQRAVAKIALFAYNRETGRGVWQSGIAPTTSTTKDVWLFGAGPFQRGAVAKGTRFAGGDIFDSTDEELAEAGEAIVPVESQAVFSEPAAGGEEIEATTVSVGSAENDAAVERARPVHAAHAKMAPPELIGPVDEEDAAADADDNLAAESPTRRFSILKPWTWR